MARFEVNSTSVDTILGWIKNGDVAIPEIQRPFVWEASEVRDLMDSLYKGFPVGYLIVWKNPDIKLKNGTISSGKRIMIDGQQRVTALTAAIVGQEIVDADYKKKRIKIAFNPPRAIAGEEGSPFEVCNPAIEKDSKWIPDIAELFAPDYNQWNFVVDYCKKNDMDGSQSAVAEVLTKIKAIEGIDFGVIELSDKLSIEEVTEIFIRINGKGRVLSQADFAMSKISSDRSYGGAGIRKLIDYFCHLMQAPADVATILQNDKDFADSSDLSRVKWITQEQDDLYQPDYKDVLRVSFTHKFHRGKLADLVSLLSGRDFEKRINVEAIAEQSFADLRLGVEAFVSETNFKRYLMILQSLGIVDASLVRSQNVLDFGYILFLSLREQHVEAAKIERLVRKWILFTILTGRYSGSPESNFDYDIRRFMSLDPAEYVANMENGNLSDAFWDYTLLDNLETSVASSPYFKLFLMAQVKRNARGFLSEQITVRSLIEQRGDIHHIFPKKYLQKNGHNNRSVYNQIANYVYTQSEINVAIKDNAPCVYMAEMKKQIAGAGQGYGGIAEEDDLTANLRENCVPMDFVEMDVSGYEVFLRERRKLMAAYIKGFYQQF